MHNITKPELELLVNNGYTAKQISENFNCSLNTVHNKLRLHGLEIKTKRESRWVGEDLKKLKLLLEDRNVTYQEMGEIFGISKQAVQSAIKKYIYQDQLSLKRMNKRNRYSKQEWKIRCLIRGRGKYKGREGLLLEDFLPPPTHCPVFGTELDYFTKGYMNDNAPSLDRLDSSKPYTKENTVIMSWRANRIKSNGTEKEHEMIANYLKSKNVS